MTQITLNDLDSLLVRNVALEIGVRQLRADLIALGLDAIFLPEQPVLGDNPVRNFNRLSHLLYRLKQMVAVQKRSLEAVETESENFESKPRWSFPA